MTLPAFLKKDSFILGVAIGIVCPFVLYLVLMVVDQVIFQVFNQHLTRAHHYLYLLSAAANLLPIRQYLSKLKHEKTGLGILAVTVVFILAYFFLFYSQS